MVWFTGTINWRHSLIFYCHFNLLYLIIQRLRYLIRQLKSFRYHRLRCIRWCRWLYKNWSILYASFSFLFRLTHGFKGYRFLIFVVDGFNFVVGTICLERVLNWVLVIVLTWSMTVGLCILFRALFSAWLQHFLASVGLRDWHRILLLSNRALSFTDSCWIVCLLTLCTATLISHFAAITINLMIFLFRQFI